LSQLWEMYLHGRHDAILDAIREMYARNKISRSLIDARVRLVLDFFTTLQVDSSYDDPLGVGLGPGIAAAAGAIKSSGNKDLISPGVVSTAQSRPSSAQRNRRRQDSLQSSAGSSRPMTQDSGRPPPLSRTRPPVPATMQVLADYSCTNTHLYLFGKLLGVQPKVCEAAKPAVAYIAVMLMVLGLCDK
jgi:hypothetical protein